MVEPLRHRQTKEAATDMFYLKPPRHISTLPKAPFCRSAGHFWSTPMNRHSLAQPAGRFRARSGSRERRSRKAPRMSAYLRQSTLEGVERRARERPARGLRCPIYNCVYKGLSLTDRIQSRGANAHRNRFALSYSPFPTVRKAHFDDREIDAAMFHGAPPLTFNCALIEATGFSNSLTQV